MKKKIVAVLLCSVMAMSALTACGGSDAAAPAAEETTEAAVEETAEAEEAEESEGCSDETFEALQEAYANLSEEVELVQNYYLENPDIPQDDDVEEALTAAQEYMDEVGEINQTDITEEDAVELADSMVEVADSLVTLAESLDIMAGADVEADAEDAGEGCSDETFAALQDAYASLDELNTTVVNYYTDNADVPQDDDVEAVLTQAQDYLDQVGAINQEDITEEDAETLAQSMLDVADGLSMIAEAIAQ